MAFTLLQQRVVCDESILGGKPIIQGTRISVEFVLDLLGSGMTFQDITQEYPHLTHEDLEAAVAFAKQVVSKEVLMPLRVASAPV